MVQPMDPTAQGFMLAESRNTPMHVGGLQLFELPDGAGPEWAREFYEESLQCDDIRPLFLKRPYRSKTLGGAWAWKHDDQFDLEYHVRHSALPAPGRVRELLELVSRVHGTRLALERPLWELYLIEGMEDGRVAIYTKLHHALVDGVSAMRLLQDTLSTDPDERTPPAWAARPRPERRPEDDPDHGALSERLAELPLEAVRTALAISSEAAGLPAALLRTLNRGIRDETAPLSLHAPRSILNRPITGARRFAAQHWPIERIKAVAKASDTTINDVVLAMCSGALRHYLDELDALPDQSLVAMVPVSLKLADAHTASSEGGNAVGTLMVKLGTQLADPAARLEAINRSVIAGKDALAQMTPAQIVAMSGIGVSPVVLLPMLRMQGLTRPPFNLVISNVPGPRQPLYLRGAHLTGMYPLSIPVHGQALNITCTSYGGMMNFGLTGCRRTAPSLQRLLTHLDDELLALEQAAGVA
ncbi:WS/DGAT/MGAT family O-acyltransferase [Nocardioides caldifontis]|uniref:WS/DGAT/MGAT family O-acyltransferase n=1 Tax=Nocardioides caldifontis TaxID=2588938 RepID=UPI0011DF2862|nr:wax ester/triacylglycerol synthase family O-acyltransferase [Nocardioides caldifontis]